LIYNRYKQIFSHFDGLIESFGQNERYKRDGVDAGMRTTPSAPRIHIHRLAWRFAPAIQRMQRTAVVAKIPAPPSPLIRGAVSMPLRIIGIRVNG